MHSKKNNINKSMNFLQGLKPFSSTLPQGIKKVLKKKNYNLANIVDNWSKIIDREIADVSYPNNVKTFDKKGGASLILNVIHGNQLNIEYKKQEILEKVNAFFGFNYIEKIKLKVVHEKKINKIDDNVLKKRKEKYNANLENIKNQNLKKSLNKLIDAYNNKNE
tara:strand:- start:163 stop:654 length:492 start_codon:yes stop_codon:yes gene_type:complete